MVKVRRLAPLAALLAIPALAQDPNVKFLDPNVAEYRLDTGGKPPTKVELSIQAASGGGYTVTHAVGGEKLSGTGSAKDGKVEVRFDQGPGAAQAVQGGRKPAATTAVYTVHPDGRIVGDVTNPDGSTTHEEGWPVWTGEEIARRIPKTELHLHIEGSFEPEQMFEIAKRNGITLKYKSVDELRAAYAFSNLQDFLDIYYQGAGVLLKEQDFYDLTWAYLVRAGSQNLRHVEMFFDPQTHTDRGVPFATVINGISRACDDARSKLGITSGLIMCFLRHLPEKNALETLEMALPFKDKLLAVGLDSSEVGHPPSDYVNVYAKARAAGLKCVAHAGEEGPPDYVYQALDLLKVDRVDHGNRALESDELVARLVKEGKPMTVCPFSNVKLRVVDTLDKHPLRRMLQAGLKISINSDDPSYFGGYVGDNWAGVARVLQLTNAEMTQLARNGIESTFLDGAGKKRLHAELDAFMARTAPAAR